jgi:hypothetical protein
LSSIVAVGAPAPEEARALLGEHGVVCRVGELMPEDLTVEIARADTGSDLPALREEVVASTTIPASNFPPASLSVSSLQPVDIVFDTPVPVVAGERYALILKAKANSGSGYLLGQTGAPFKNVGDAYAGGQRIYQTCPFGASYNGTPCTTSQWIRGGVTDLIFGIYIVPQDTTAPTTTATPSPHPNEAGWNNSDVTVSLSAKDQGGSGVEKITYSASGAQTIEQTDGPGSSVEVKIDQEGTTTLTYFATDEAGNDEAPQTLEVKIDKTAPSVAGTGPFNYQTGVPATTPITAVFSDSERSGSGIDDRTLTDGNFKVEQVKPTGNVQVQGSVVYDANYRTATFYPSSRLAKGLYRVTLTGVEDNVDNMMPDYTWTFATAGPPSQR